MTPKEMKAFFAALTDEQFERFMYCYSLATAAEVLIGLLPDEATRRQCVGEPEGDVVTVKLEDGVTFISHVWFVGGDQCDWLCTLYRDLPAGVWKVTYRFRYYVDDKTHGSEDVKNSYEVQCGHGDVAKRKAIELSDQLADLCAREFGGGEVHKVFVGSANAKEYIQVMSREPWFHVGPKVET